MERLICVFFFFQAEDGIRDGHVTGVQRCALPISNCDRARFSASRRTMFPARDPGRRSPTGRRGKPRNGAPRSEERRVGKECRAGWGGEGWREKVQGGELRGGRRRIVRITVSI